MVLDAIGELIANQNGHDKPSNFVPLGEFGGFYERGRENDDGAITGAVFRITNRLTDDERKAWAVVRGIADHPEWIGDPARRAGSFRIEPDGQVSRFPGVRGQLIGAAIMKAGKRYLETFGTLERTIFPEPEAL